MKNTRVNRPKITFPLVAQQTDSHCGPATLQALFQFLNKQFTQDQIVMAAKVKSRLQRYGTRPDHLARAIAVLAPDTQFWFKQGASAEDLATLIKKYHWPVAVNWQGLFYENPAEEKRRRYLDGDYGHYSIVIDIDIAKDKIVIADPYSEYVAKPRTFSLQWFLKRWWDEDIHTYRGVKDAIYTRHFMFVIVPNAVTFPTKVGMMLADQLEVLRQPQGLKSILPSAQRALRTWF